jgi:hypothetical protein
MRCRDKQSCQKWYERELKEATERLESMRNASHALRPDVRLEWERRLDELRGRLNRGAARLEALRRANTDNWRTAAAHAEEAFTALSEALAQLDRRGPELRSIAA